MSEGCSQVSPVEAWILFGAPRFSLQATVSNWLVLFSLLLLDCREEELQRPDLDDSRCFEGQILKSLGSVLS